MTDVRAFLTIATRHLCRPWRSKTTEFGDGGRPHSQRSWCCWTTFDRLECDTIYWHGELPEENELLENSVADGGSWRQPFPYSEIAHVIIPRIFLEEPCSEKGTFTQWEHEQDIKGLSKLLQAAEIQHKLHAFALELKLY